VKGYIGKKVALIIVGSAMALTLAGSAGAVAPTLSSISQQDRHAIATFSAPRADSATIYLATKPDRATDGSFLQENIKTLDILTDSEIQSGRWSDENQLDPGTYWAMLRASPDFDSCYIFESGTFDPACADGFSNVLVLTIPRPTIRYTATVRVYRFISRVLLRFIAKPLGERMLYRVCYRLKNGASRCVRGILGGFSWNAAAEHTLTVNSRNLAATTTFSWYVDGRRVVSKRVRVR
jgi:hypothetical protein